MLDRNSSHRTWVGIKDQIGRGSVLIANPIEDRYDKRAIEIHQDITAVSFPGDIAQKLGVRSSGLLVRRWYMGSDDRL